MKISVLKNYRSEALQFSVNRESKIQFHVKLKKMSLGSTIREAILDNLMKIV